MNGLPPLTRMVSTILRDLANDSAKWSKPLLDAAAMAEAIQHARDHAREHGITSRKLAELLGISMTQLSQWTAVEPDGPPDFVRKEKP